MTPSRWIRTHLPRPEATILLFAFLVNLPWEFWQVPFYHATPDLRHWPAIKVCSAAALGDATITLVAFWVIASAATRRWILHPRLYAVTAFVALAVLIGTSVEWLSVHRLERWSYAAAMPIVPLVGIGLVPLLQWLLLPPIVVWLVRRHLT